MSSLNRALTRFGLPDDLGGVFVSLLLRLLLIVFTIDSLINAGDERFAGKALGPRNLVILFGFAMLFPVLFHLTKQWKQYPWWFDATYLSIFFLDMAGNSVNAYNSRPSSRPCRGRRSDRKSTRLNSSHPVISYAVFSLKKKTSAHPFSCLGRVCVR